MNAADTKAVAEALRPLGIVIADAIAATPVRLGSADSAGELASAITAQVALHVSKEFEPLISALRLIHEDMFNARSGGDEWASEWLQELWVAHIPIAVRAVAGDEDALDELTAMAAERGESS